MTDEKLLQRAARGDEAAFLTLYERHRGAVFRFAYRVLGSAALAEEITHDCFLSLVRRPEGFDPSRASLRTYLYAAARNLSAKHLRRRGGEQTSGAASSYFTRVDMEDFQPADEMKIRVVRKGKGDEK